MVSPLAGFRKEAVVVNAGGVQIALDIDLRVFAFELQHFQKQIPFAISRTVNAMLLDAQGTVQDQLPRSFTMRPGAVRKGKPWIAHGIQVELSGYRHAEKEGKIGSIDRYMEAQAVGGAKTPFSASHVAIPMVGRGAPRPTLKDITRPSTWPRNIVKRKGTSFAAQKRTPNMLVKGQAFEGVINGLRGIWQPNYVGAGVRGGERGWLRLLWALKPRVKIDARWPLKEEVEYISAARFEDHARDQIRHALATRTPGH